MNWFNHVRQGRELVLLLAVCVIMAGGCSHQASAPDQEGIAADSTDHHDGVHDHSHPHESLHLNSISFAAATRRLPRRIWVVATEWKAGHREHATDATNQLHELVRFLPELAADTDLGESDWLTVHETCGQMASIIKSWSTGRSSPTGQEIDSLVVLSERLKPLAELTRTDDANQQLSDDSKVTAPKQF